MEIEILPARRDGPAETSNADIAWLPDQPSPFGDDQPPLYRAILLHEQPREPREAGSWRYRVELVTGKEGPAGAIQLLALIERRQGISQLEAFRHWDEHIPLAVEIHHKALRYRQFRFTEKLSPEAPDYVGFAVLDFASAQDLRTGLFRNEADVAVISEDVAEFIGRSDVLYGTERS